jgi:hypothetical protein
MASASRVKVSASPKSPARYESRSAKRSKIASSTVSPVPWIAASACSRRSPGVQSSTATPTIGQFNRPRRSSRYSERKVITFARSPVIPNTTKTSAGCGGAVARVVRAGVTSVVIDPPCLRCASHTSCLRARLQSSPAAGDPTNSASPL